MKGIGLSCLAGLQIEQESQVDERQVQQRTWKGNEWLIRSRAPLRRLELQTHWTPKHTSHFRDQGNWYLLSTPCILNCGMKYILYIIYLLIFTKHFARRILWTLFCRWDRQPRLSNSFKMMILVSAVAGFEPDRPVFKVYGLSHNPSDSKNTDPKRCVFTKAENYCICLFCFHFLLLIIMWVVNIHGLLLITLIFWLLRE